MRTKAECSLSPETVGGDDTISLLTCGVTIGSLAAQQAIFAGHLKRDKIVPTREPFGCNVV
jgi:hypothetical protein